MRSEWVRAAARGVLCGWVLSFWIGFAFADQSDPQTGVTGTDSADVISIDDPLDVNASLTTSQGEKLDASATGVDAKGGDDSITANASLDATATTSAVITSDPAETEANSTSTGVNAGDGADTVVVAAPVTATSTGLAAYGNDLDVQHDESSTDQKLDVSVTATTDATGVDSGAGADTVINSNVVSGTSTATSGGSADQLSATVQKSVELKTAATATASSTGVAAGEDGDQVTNSGAIAATSTAISGALAVGVAADQSTPPPGGTPSDAKTQISLDASAAATATANGVITDADAVQDSSDDVLPWGVDLTGLKITYSKTLTSVSGDDELVNTALVSAIASAISGAGAVGITDQVNGTVESKAGATATASAAGLSTGGGADTITNAGILDAIATAVADAVSVSLEVGKTPTGGGTQTPPDKSNKASSDTSVTAVATSAGIDAEGAGQIVTISRSAEITDGALVIDTSTTTDALAGDDTVNNQAVIAASASAISSTKSGGVTIGSGGSTVSKATSSAQASSSGIYTGGGNDAISNAFDLSSDATASASAVGVSLGVGQGAETPPADGSTPPATPPPALAARSDTTTTATAAARGIDAEGAAQTTATRHVAIDDSGIVVTVGSSTTAQQGNDILDNAGALTVSAEATSDSTDASLDIDAVGSLDAKAGATADAIAQAITTGGGDDAIGNLGLLTSSATADASAIALGLVVKQPADESSGSGSTPPADKPEKSNVEVEGQVTSSATAVGIDAEGVEPDTDTTTTVTITRNSLEVSRSQSTTALTGADSVQNDGAVFTDAGARSSTKAAGLVLDVQGSAQVDADATATANSLGVFTGAGDDTVGNTGALTSTATADAQAIALSLSVTQPEQSATPTDPSYLDQLKDKYAAADSKANAVATASASGIDAEGAAQQSDASTTVTIDGSGLSIDRSASTTSLAGDDILDNGGLLGVAATATSGAAAAVVQVQTEGTAKSESNATATAEGTGITTGGGNDSVGNDGAIGVGATSGAGALSVSFTQTDGAGAPSKSDAKATSTSTAVGIRTDGGTQSSDTTSHFGISSDGVAITLSNHSTGSAGVDNVDNGGAITVDALSGSGAGSGAISIDGAASADVQSQSRASATGVTTGGGADAVTNTGLLTSTATGSAGVLAVGFGQNTSETTKAKLKVSVDAKATAIATADGIAADDGVAEQTADGHLTISSDGFDAAFTGSQTAFRSADTIDNQGAVYSAASALTGALGGAVALDGAASADVTATSTARAGGLDAGGGDDSIGNSGGIETLATATGNALSIGFGQKTSETAKVKVNVESSATATADAAGIRGDSGVDRTLDSSLTIDGSGLHAALTLDEQAATGADSIDNSGALSTNAVALAGAAGASIAIDGVAKADIDSKAESQATAIAAGGGDDVVTNSGLIAASADSTSVAMAAAIGEKSSATSSARTKVSANSTSTATAVGVGADSGAKDQSTSVTLDIDDNGLAASLSHSETAVSGDDTVINNGAIGALATASSGTEAVALSIKAAARTDAGSDANASAFAIDSGGGADFLTNAGALGATSVATANTVSASISSEGRAVENAGLLGGGTTATSKAVGLSSAGDVQQQSYSIDTAIDFDSISLTASFDSLKDGLQDGADTIDNSATIDASSTAESGQLSVGITGKGVAVSIGRVKTDSTASAIESGNGDDVIGNTGDLTASSHSTAVLGNVAVTGKGLAVAANSVWDGGTEANSIANGIDADSGSRETQSVDVVADLDLARVRYNSTFEAASGNDTVTNSGAIAVDAHALAPSLSVAVSAGSGAGMAAAVSTSTAHAEANAIRGGDGNDTLDNSGDLTSSADAEAYTANAAVTNKGVAAAADAVWDGGTKAEAIARGIAGDGGDVSRSTYLSVGSDGIDHDSQSVLADGADTITNFGSIGVDAAATAKSFSVAAAVTGVGAATATSTATADAAAIDAGGGGAVDDVYNAGALTANATADATAASVSVTNQGAAVSLDSVWDGGTKANAQARGITTGAGAETIGNDGAIDTTATAFTRSVAASVTNQGIAGASATATATADATAIDAGDDAAADTVNNTGTLHATSDAEAQTASISVTNSGVSLATDAVWDSGTTANSTVRGIEVGAGADAIDNSGDVTVAADAQTYSASVSVSMNGAAGALSRGTAIADSIALNLGGDEVDDDSVFNSGALSATADATAASAAIGFVANGLAVAGGNVWDGGTHGDAHATTIALGGGNDTLTNEGALSADADAVATGISVSVAINGVAGAITAASADADAVAIDAGSGDDVLTNSGDITSMAHANANTVSVAATQYGVSVAGNNAWDGGTNGTAIATGIRAGAGLDSIDNSGAIASSATVVAPSTAISFTVGGVAASVSTATADADASAIDAGADDDTISNTGALSATADGNAVAVNVALTGIGAGVAADSVWDGGTTAQSSAAGIRGGDGDDVVGNTTAAGTIDATADADATSVSVSITAAGFAGAVTTSTSTADAQAIDAGAGADNVHNDSVLNADAEASSTSVAVSVVGAGGALAADSFWDGGTKATGTAIGIGGAAGVDAIDNAGEVAAEAHSHTSSVSVAGTLSGGFAGAAAASTSRALATALDGGDDADTLSNSGQLSATSQSDAQGVSVAFAATGVAVAGAFVDNATVADATATGISGGAGTDQLDNVASGSIVLDANAFTRDTAFTRTVAGLSAADSNTTASASAFGLDGGDDADQLDNAGTITGTLTANANSVGISLSLLGAALASANAEGNVTGAGLRGGAGDDGLDNGGSVTLTGTASAVGQSIAAVQAGAAISDASADAIGSLTGLDGGDGSDALSNSGTLHVDVAGSTTARSISAAQLGAALAKANSTATANGIGMAGGAGDDSLGNAATGTVEVSASADAVAQSVSISVAGAADGEARTRPVIAAAGLSGDAGDDSLVNDGTVTVAGRAKSYASGTTVSVAGSSTARAGTDVEANLVGLGGGDGADSIANHGTVTVGAPAGQDWMATLDVRASSFGFAGGSEADTEALASTTSTGIDGGADADQIANDGDITVLASALNHSDASTMSIFGSGAAGGESGAATQAFGIDAGSGTNVVDNTGAIDVTARSRLELISASYSFAGSGSSGGTLAAVTRADGLSGGDAADALTNGGSLTVAAESSLSSKGKSSATFGGSSGTTTSGGRTAAYGMQGGAGDDLLANTLDGVITVDADTNVATEAMSYTFGGGSSNSAVLTGITDAAGLVGGSGIDTLSNAGSIDVEARATLTANGAAETTIGGGTSTGRSVAGVTATGIDGGDDADSIDSSGTVTVASVATAEARNSTAVVLSISSDAETGAFTQASAQSTGLDGGAGENTIDQSGALDVTADAIGYGWAYASGATVSFDGDAYSRAFSDANATAVGIAAGDDGNTVTNTGAVDVTAHATTAKDFTTTVTYYTPPTDADGAVVNRDALTSDALPTLTTDQGSLDAYPTGTTWFWNSANAEQDPNLTATGAYYQIVVVQVPDPNDSSKTIDERQWQRVLGDVEENTIVESSLPTYASANGNGLDGDGRAISQGTAEANAYGVALGAGADAVDNSASIHATARAEGVARTASDGDAFGDAHSTSTGGAVARAWGIDLGAGDNQLSNSGEIVALATPAAQAASSASGGDICIYFFFWTWCGGGGKGYGTATADFEALAVGVTAADGADTIINDGLIRAVAAPEVRTDPRYGAYVVSINASDSSSPGVLVTSTAVGIETGAGNDTVVNNGAIEAEAHALPGFTRPLAATGVDTGAGDDVVENYGSISAQTFVDTVATADVGITMGDGNDALTLGDGSSVIGSIDLGTGNDTLTLIGTPTVADASGAPLVPQGGDGDDSLVLDGAGAFAAAPASFEHAQKVGAGTFTLPALASLDTLTIDEGVLALDADYAFLPTGSYSTYFDTSGDAGQLAVTGTASIDGAIDVEKKGDGYVSDGTRYSVVTTTNAVSGAFSDVTLPAPLPLLSFALEATPTTVDVVADAASFTTVAGEPLYRRIAANLDTVAPAASGDFATVMGNLQTLTGNFDAAFATLSPDPYFAGDQALQGANMQILRLLGQHLASTRAVYRDRLPTNAAYGQFSVAYNEQGYAAVGFSSNPNLGTWDDNRIAQNLQPIAYAAPAGAGAAQASPSKAETWALGVLDQGSWDNVDGYAKFDTDSSAIALGQDYRVRDDIVLGASIGRTYSKAKLNDIGAKTDVDGWYGSLYGTWFSDRTYVEASLSYASQSFDTKRPVTVGALTRLAKSDYDGDTWMASLASGYEFTRGTFYAEPYAALYYFATSVDGLTESGAGSANQIVKGHSWNALLGELGGRIGVIQTLGRGALDWHASAAWNYDFDIDTAELKYAYAGAPGAFFTIDARNLEANSAVAGAGVTYLGRASTLSLDYRGVFNSDYDDQALGLTLSFRF